MTNMNMRPVVSPPSSGASVLWVLTLVIVVPCFLALGIVAWVNGREVGFGVLVVAAAVAFGCERIASTNRRR